MFQPVRVIVPILLAALAACSGSDDRRQREVMKPEDTVVGDLVTAPGRVEARTNAAVEAHRDALESRLREDEGNAQDED